MLTAMVAILEILKKIPRSHAPVWERFLLQTLHPFRLPFITHPSLLYITPPHHSLITLYPYSHILPC